MLPLHRIVWSAAEWVEVLDAAPSLGALPARVVLVPSHEAGEAIRGALVRAQRPDLLAGLQLVTPLVAALQTLATAGIVCDAGEDRLRAARVSSVAQGGLALRTLDPALFADGRGWDEAVADVLRDLEAAGLTPVELRARGDARLSDFAAIWDACDAAAGPSWTRARVLREATAALRRDASAWPFDGPVMAIAAGDETAVAADFARAVPEARLVALPARPLHPRSLARWTALWGEATREAIVASAADLATAAASPGTERDRLARWLFAPLDVVLGEREASPGDDGTLSLESHAGVEDECGAAVEWVAREVLDRGTPVARIALLVPSLDPVAAVLVQRLGELPWPGDAPPLYVAGGLPLAAHPAGARLSTAVEALHAGDESEQYAPLCAARDGSLASMWDALRAWWLEAGDDTREARMAFDAVAVEAEPLVADGALRELAGSTATRLLCDAAGAARWPHGSLGAGVYIGTLESATGLDFDAVRVLGLAEGSVPPSPRDHPLLADAARGALSAALPLALDASLTRLHALERSVRAAACRVAWSAPLTGADRGQRSPGTVFVDAATAVRRAMPDGSVPRVADARALEVAWFAAASSLDATAPTVRQRARAAAASAAAPLAWCDAGAWDGAAAQRLARAGEPAIAPVALPDAGVPGLTAARALSASAAQSLLRCPRAFFFTRVLDWREPDPPQSPYALAPMEYGSLLHEVLERFGERHGAAFGEREDTLDAWIARGQALAVDVMHATLERRALRGASVRAALENRLLSDVRLLLRYDWNGGTPRRFAGVELTFGEPDALPLGPAAGGLFVRGRIDRLDVEDGTSFLRDFKSGRAYPREDADFDPVYDLQLGVYLLVLDRLADTWGVPAQAIAAFVYPGHGADQERAFRADAALLARMSAEWLSVCAALLGAREFPQTPEPLTCERCAFRRVCGEEAPSRAAAMLATTPQRASAAFAALWMRAADEEEADA